MQERNYGNVIIVIQARLSSKRLPRKVIMQTGFNNETIISCQLKRLSKLKDLGIKICVATSIDESDNELVDYLSYNFPNLFVFRGSLNNVLERYYHCAMYLQGDIVVRLTADCPFSDPDLIAEMIDEFLSKNLDYLSNTMPPEQSTFSDGFDVEIFKFDVLEECNKKMLSDSDREHVTFHMWKSGKYKTGVFLNQKQVEEKIKLSIDYVEDFNLFKVLLQQVGIELKYYEIDNHIIENKLFKINDPNKINAGWQIK
jgi:spore coat polysaccharide biosynthesis protein SpsF (cytidylyltransferase family)